MGVFARNDFDVDFCTLGPSAGSHVSAAGHPTAGKANLLMFELGDAALSGENRFATPCRWLSVDENIAGRDLSQLFPAP